MSHADWFAKKLGPTQAPRSAVPQQLPSVGGLRLPQQPPQHSEPVPQQMVQQVTQDQITGKENFEGLINSARSRGEHVTFTGLSRHWKGGEAMKAEGHLRCPNCDSLNIFTRSKVRIMNDNGQTGHARPRCFDCGWTEDYTPGNRDNWAS